MFITRAGWQKFEQIPDQKLFDRAVQEVQFPRMPYELELKVLFYSPVALISCQKNPAGIELMPGCPVP